MEWRCWKGRRGRSKGLPGFGNDGVVSALDPPEAAQVAGTQKCHCDGSRIVVGSDVEWDFVQGGAGGE